MKVALDTNVLVSAFATRGLCADLLHLVLAEHQLVVGVTVLGELKRVLRQKMHVPGHVIEEVEALLRREATIPGKAGALAVRIRDHSDAAVLAEAVAAGAEVLVTGDRDLLDVADRVPISILSPRGFWERLRETKEPGDH